MFSSATVLRSQAYLFLLASLIGAAICGAVWGCSISKSLVAILEDDGTTIWLHQDADEQIVLEKPKSGSPVSLAANGRYPSIVAFARSREHAIHLYSLTDNKEVASIDFKQELRPGLSLWLQGFAFSPDGKSLAVVLFFEEKMTDAEGGKWTQELRFYDARGSFIRSHELDEIVTTTTGLFINVSWNADSTQLLLSRQVNPDSHRELSSKDASRGLLVQVLTMDMMYLPIAEARFIDSNKFIAVNFLKSKSAVSLMEVTGGELRSIRNYTHSAPLWSDPRMGRYLVSPSFLYRAPAYKSRYDLYVAAEDPRLLESLHLRCPRTSVVIDKRPPADN